MTRSWLYVPANNARFVARAHERGADAIILDLEDSVAQADKAEARAGLMACMSAVGRGGAQVFVRINADPVTQHADAEAACRAGANGLVIPKVQSAETLAALADMLEGIERQLGREPLKLIATIEDPGAVLDARAIARAPRLVAMNTGSEDLALALGALPTPEVLRFPKLMVHYAAKAAGLLSLGLLRSIADYSDLEAITAAIAEAADHGFDGATCVHPSVVPLLNAGFSPGPEQVMWARRLLAEAGLRQGAFAMDGQMVDAPVIARARDILRRAELDS